MPIGFQLFDPELETSDCFYWYIGMHPVPWLVKYYWDQDKKR